MNGTLKKLNWVNLTFLYASLLVLFTFSTQLAASNFTLSLNQEHIIAVLTSPFNSYFEQHYPSNIVLVLMILLLAELYFKYRKRAVQIKFALIFSILASYIVSLDVILVQKVPSAGSSIVGSSIFVFLAFFLAYDSIRFISDYLKFPRVHNAKGHFIYLMLSFLMLLPGSLVMILFYYGAYVKDNYGVMYHILGLIAFVLLLLYYLRKRRKGLA